MFLLVHKELKNLSYSVSELQMIDYLHCGEEGIYNYFFNKFAFLLEYGSNMPWLYIANKFMANAIKAVYLCIKSKIGLHIVDR